MVLQEESNGRAMAEMLNLSPTNGKVVAGQQVLLNPSLLSRFKSHPRLMELLDLINNVDSREEEPLRMFFFDPERSLLQKNLQIFYISLDNLSRILTEAKLPKVPNPLQVICGFTLRPPPLGSSERRPSGSRRGLSSALRKRPSIASEKANRSVSSG